MMGLSRIWRVKCSIVSEMISNYLVVLARPLFQSFSIHDRDNSAAVFAFAASSLINRRENPLGHSLNFISSAQGSEEETNASSSESIAV